MRFRPNQPHRQPWALKKIPHLHIIIVLQQGEEAYARADFNPAHLLPTNFLRTIKHVADSNPQHRQVNQFLRTVGKGAHQWLVGAIHRAPDALQPTCEYEGQQQLQKSPGALQGPPVCSDLVLKLGSRLDSEHVEGGRRHVFAKAGKLLGEWVGGGGREGQDGRWGKRMGSFGAAPKDGANGSN